MCTVTIIPKGENDFVLTSNRDEAPNRVSLAPNFYQVNNTKMLFPKDEKAGGTWIGLSERNRLICLLNGGFEFHKKQDKYLISRGLVVTDLLAAPDIVNAIEAYNFFNIEPFTLVIADWNSHLKFIELVWDGSQKHVMELPKEAKIWSSSTLYSDEMKNDRQQWFEQFKSANELTSVDAKYFHKFTHNHNKEYGVIMDRGFVKTTSITQVEKIKGEVVLNFENLQENTLSSSTMLFSEAIHD